MKARSYLSIVLATIFVACSNKASDKFFLDDQLGNQAVIAQTIDVNGHDVTVLKLGLVNDTVNIPLSYLAEKLQIVPLDNRDEALVGNSKVYVSDNYILVTRSTGSHSIPCKLFKKDGTRFATAKVRIVSVQYKGSNLINLLFRNPLTFSSLRVDSMTKKPLIV